MRDGLVQQNMGVARYTRPAALSMFYRPKRLLQRRPPCDGTGARQSNAGAFNLANPVDHLLGTFADASISIDQRFAAPRRHPHHEMVAIADVHAVLAIHAHFARDPNERLAVQPGTAGHIVHGEYNRDVYRLGIDAQDTAVACERLRVLATSGNDAPKLTTHPIAPGCLLKLLVHVSLGDMVRDDIEVAQQIRRYLQQEFFLEDFIASYGFDQGTPQTA